MAEDDGLSSSKAWSEHEKKKRGILHAAIHRRDRAVEFPGAEPEVVEMTIESQGENLLKGDRNLLEDLARGDGPAVDPAGGP